MVATMKNKQVSYNLENPEEKRQYEFVKAIKNYSGYVKGLVGQDMEKNKPGELENAPGKGVTIKGGVAKM
jgi:hypothetical protein